MNEYKDLEIIAKKITSEAMLLVQEKRKDLIEKNGHVGFTTKTSVTDPVTEVDVAIEKFVREKLAQLRPGDMVVGEEIQTEAKQSKYTWYIDPIDGTVNFLYGIPGYSVSLGVAEGETLIAGAVADIVHGTVYHAHKGGGARKSVIRDVKNVDSIVPETIQASSCVTVKESLVGTGFSYLTETREKQGKIFANLIPQIRDIRRIGAAAMDLCNVASGSLDIYYEESIKPWDCAAGLLIAQESGAVTQAPPIDNMQGALVWACAPGVAKEWSALTQKYML